MAEHVGTRLRQLRQQRGLSLRQVAQRTGYTPGFLSLVERNRCSLTLTSLKRIADALDVPLYTLFTLPDTSEAVYGVLDGSASPPLTVIEQPDIHYHLLSGRSPSKAMDPMIVTIFPSASHRPPEVYVHEGEEFGYVLSGQLTVTVAGKAHLLRSGDSIHFSSSAPHSWENRGTEPVRAIWVVTPRLF